MESKKRSTRMLEHVVLQEPPASPSSSTHGSPAPHSSRVAVAIELEKLYDGTSSGNLGPKRKSDRRKLRRKPNLWTIKYYQRLLRKLVRSKEWTIAMIIVIFYVLFVDDIVAMTKAYKNHGLFEGIGISKMVVLAIFILEFLIQIFAMRREYNYKSLFFWLDLIAIGSLIPDILLLAYGANATASVSTLAIARAGRAARASGRVARILRVSQFYSCFGYNRREEEERRMSDPPQVYLEPSRMGNRLINRTTNKVVVIVLVLLFVSSFLQSELDATPFVRGGLTELEALRDMGTDGAAAFTAATQRYIASQRHLIFLQVRGTVVEANRHAMDNIFTTSLLKFKTVKDVNNPSVMTSEAWFDNRDEMAVQGGYSLGLLLLVIVLLTLGNLLIIRDATRMVIIPMERVLAVLKQLSPGKPSNRVGRSISGNGGGAGGSGGGGSARSRDSRRSDFSDTSDDMTSNSGLDDDEDEAEALFGMLNDIDGNLQAAKERAEREAGENQRLRTRIMDLVAEKKLVEIQVAGIKRRAKQSAETHGGVNRLDDVVEVAMQASRGMMRIATTAQKVNFGLAIGGRKFMSFMEADSNDIRFSHSTLTSGAHPFPPPSPTAARLRTHSSSEVETSQNGSVTLAAPAPAPAPARLELPQVQAATLERLIERLTYEEYTDAKFIHTFLLTYRSILSPVDLMERLLIRFCYVTPATLLPNDISLEAVEEWRKQKQEPVRLGVCNALKLWIGRYFWDFESNEELVRMLRDFITHLLPETMMDRHATNIESLFNKKTEEEHLEKRIPYSPPEALTSEVIDALCTGESDFARFELVDLARQITLVEHDLYRAIKPSELLGQAWTKKSKEHDSPNILRLIDHFNNISAWIKTQVVKPPKAKDRATSIKRAVTLSEEFLKLGNFNGAMEVLAALSNASVSRLKKTWILLPAATTESFQDLGQLMSSQSSFKLYRERLHSSTPPCIPYIGVYLSDLVFIDEGNPDSVESPTQISLVNFDKNRQVATTINEIQKYQHVTYYKSDTRGAYVDEEDDGIETNEEIAAFVKGLRGIDDDIAYKTSLLSEPRARAGSAISLSPSPSFLDRLRNSTPTGTL